MERHLAGIPARYLAEHSLPAAFRIVHFPNMDDLEAAGELGEWARRNGVAVDFEKRSIGIGAVQHDVICVLFLTG